MKKFLSMVLALVMAMSLVTVSAGAKDFNDSDKISDIAYEEAVNVMSEMGIIDGYGDGNFQPQGTLTRGAAAKIIACMMLGKTTAEALGTQAAPFKDVPVGSTFAGYIAYCVESGIIDGYSDGTFRPGNTLTGFAFLKMLLTALGYDSAIEGYANNANWTVNVAGRAKQIGLLDGNDEFVGTRAATREEACLYAVNALQATLVEYSDKGGSISVGDITINTGASNATYVTSNVYDQATSINTYRDNGGAWTVEFAEKYQPDLELKDAVDAFGRPAHTWTWKKAEVGTYVEYDKMVGEFTEKVTGRDLVDLLTKATIDDNQVLVYIDGVTDVNINGDIFGAGNMIKSNTEKVGATGDGVLTQVFLDTVEDEITIAIINTYLAQADEDYNAKTEDLDLTVYAIDMVRNTAYVKDTDEDETMTVEVEDFDIEDVSEDDLFLVTVADGEIQTMEAPEIVSEASVTSFKLGSYVTADGTQYDYADTAMYDEEVLDAYDDHNMKDVTYNVILDPYGYLIGIELNSDPDQYVFLTGMDLGASNLSAKNADANVIFLDGKMDTVTVNMRDSEFAAGTIHNGGQNAQINTWCTYTVNDSGVYTLEEVAGAINTVNKIKVAQVAQDVRINAPVTINQKNVSLNGAGVTPGVDDYVKVYGNDETVYLNVELDNIEDRTGAKVQIIDDVESVTTGVKNVDIEVTHIANTAYTAPDEEIYTLYDKDGYIIAAVTIGENNGTSSSYAYITSKSVNKEALTSSETASYALNTKNDSVTTYATTGTYRWTREAIVDGEIVELTEVGDNLKVLNKLEQGLWYEIKYDGNGNVRGVDKTNEVDADRNGYYDGIPFAAGTSKFISDVASVNGAVNANNTNVLLFDTTTVDKLVFQSGTLYTSTKNNLGFDVSPNVKVVLALAGKDGGTKDWFDDVDDDYTGYAGLEKALDDMNVANHENFSNASQPVEISALLVNGSATVIVINDMNSNTGINTGTPTVPTTEYDPIVTQNGPILEVQANTYDGNDAIIWAAAINWLNDNGYTLTNIMPTGANDDPTDYYTVIATKNGSSYYFTTKLIVMVKLYINDVAGFYKDGTNITMTGPNRSTTVTSAQTLPLAGTAGTSTTMTYPVSWANNGKYVYDSLVEITVNGTKGYYQIGSKIDATGDWYQFTGEDAKAMPASGLVVTKDMEDKTLTIGHKVTVTKDDDSVLTEIVKDGGATTTMSASGLTGWIRNDNGSFFATNSGNIKDVTCDITVTDGTDDGYFKITGLADKTVADDFGNKTDGMYTYTISSANAVKVGNDWYAKGTDTITVSITWASGDISGTKDTITVACDGATLGAAAAVEFNGNYNADGANNTKTVTIKTFTKDSKITVTGDHTA